MGAELFCRDPLATEMKLKEELFVGDKKDEDVIPTGKLNADTDLNDGKRPDKNFPARNWKISGAQCLLEYEPNGFSCIGSFDPIVLEAVRKIAIENYTRKKFIADSKNLIGKQPHHDHAHYVCVVKRSNCEYGKIADKA